MHIAKIIQKFFGDIKIKKLKRKGKMPYNEMIEFLMQEN